MSTALTRGPLVRKAPARTVFHSIVAALLFLLAACSRPVGEPAADDKTADESPPIELIARDLLFGNPTRSQARISPNGQWLSWLAPVDGVLNIHVAPAAAPEDVRTLTRDSGRGIRVHFWAYDSQTLLYLQDQGGNENTHLYAVAVGGGDVRTLTPVDDSVRVTLQGLSPLHPNRVVVGMNDRVPSLFDLHSIDLRSGERTLLMENPGYAGWVLDKNLEPQLALQPLEGGAMDLVQRTAEAPWKAIARIPADDALTTNVIGINSAGTAVSMLDSRDRDRVALTRLDLSSGELTVLAEHDRADIDDAFLDPTTREPLAYSANDLTREWYALDERMGKALAALAADPGGELQLVSRTQDLAVLLAYSDRSDAPGRYVMYRAADDAVVPVLNTRPALENVALQPTEAVAIEARDGLRLVSYLTRPAEQDGPVPMVLLVHGGPWARDEAGYSGMRQMLANRGYAVLNVNYRGSTGFGKSFLNAAVDEFAGKMHDDLIDAVSWAIAEGVADPNRVAIMGGSYGGYATLVGLTFTPDTFACGVDIVGPSSLVTLVESFPDYWRPFLEATWYTFVGNPAEEEDRAAMLNRSPISRVADIKVPLLIGQGENDPRVTKLEADQLVAAMQERKLPVTYLNYPDEGHGFARPENRLSFYATTEHFLAECLGGRAEPFGTAFEGSSVEVLAGADYVPALAELAASGTGD